MALPDQRLLLVLALPERIVRGTRRVQLRAFSCGSGRSRNSLYQPSTPYSVSYCHFRLAGSLNEPRVRSMLAAHIFSAKVAWPPTQPVARSNVAAFPRYQPSAHGLDSPEYVRVCTRTLFIRVLVPVLYA